MKLLSRRFEHSADGTASTSHLYIEQVYECFLLEDRVREPKDRPADPAQLPAWVASWKVPKRTAIPSGTYRILWTRSPKFSAHAGYDVFTLEIQDVPGFQGIRFHAGNDPEDTEGCQLPGRTHTPGSSSVGESKLALAALEVKVCAALVAHDKIMITITNEFPDDAFFAPGKTLKG